jgi:hypothetical protein
MRELLDLESGASEIKKPTVFKLVKKNHRPALQGRYYPAQTRIPSEEVIYDPTTNKNRVIRYAPGEGSVYKDEQTQSTPEQKVVVGDIIFQHGSLIVDHTNPLLLAYLSLSNFNHSNPNRVKGSKILFAEVNSEKEADMSLENEAAQARAVNYVMNMEFDDLMGYARVLNVNTNRSVKEVRHDMVIMSKKDPERFIAGADDPVNKRKQVIMTATKSKIIEVSGRSINWVFGDKKSLITPVPIGQDAVTWFAEWTMSEKDGEKVYAEIEKQLKKLS